MNPAIAFSLVYLLGAAIALAAVAVIWPRRAAPGGTPLALMLAAAAFWAICDAIELHLPTAGGKLFISQVQYIGVIAAAPLFFHAAIALSGRTGPMATWMRVAVWAVPLVSLLIAWTNPWHHWLWTGILSAVRRRCRSPLSVRVVVLGADRPGLPADVGGDHRSWVTPSAASGVRSAQA